jgi:hypothetical protein
MLLKRVSRSGSCVSYSKKIILKEKRERCLTFLDDQDLASESIWGNRLSLEIKQ